MIWGAWVMEQAMTVAGRVKISLAVVIMTAVFVISGGMWAYAWADGEFARVEDLTRLQHTVDTGFEKIAINDASAEIRDRKLSLQMAMATQAPPTEVDRINEELNHAKNYKQCLVDRGSNCEHLREVE